jgi:pimeloyl-ACP methyl ester carboxylesterase
VETRAACSGSSPRSAGPDFAHSRRRGPAEGFAAAELLEKELPNVRKAIMHGTAHVPNMERPEEFNRIVLDFLKDFR